MSSLRPAHDFAIRFGVKAIVYGKPGSSKTPIANTAPRPLLLACEPGLRSMVGSKVATWPAYTPAKIDEFFKWFFSSAEVKNFDTLCIDSVSQMADVYLQDSLKRIKHGMQAYGDMATKVMDHLRTLYFTERMHTYLICKQEDLNENGVIFKRPYFPGKQLSIDIPHMFDEILHLAKVPIPGAGEQLAFRCHNSFDVLARDRTGRLNEFEPPNFGDIIKKCMS